MTIRVGVIGVGVMGSDHARRLRTTIADATVSAVTDINTERASALAAELDAGTFGSAEDLIAADTVDAVIIASRDADHAQQVALCLRHRKPVLCEKPLAPTVSACRDIVAAQAALDLPHPLISVGFMRRFDPAYVELAAALRAGAVGEPLMVRCSHRNKAAYPGGDSAATITNSAIHEIDITSWLLDSPVIEVSWHAGKSTSADRSRQDPQVLLLRTANGVLTVADVFVNAGYGYDVRCEVIGELGAMSLPPAGGLRIDRDLQSHTGYPADWLPRFQDAYRLELQAWITSLVENTTTPLATAEDGLCATEVAAALVTSMSAGGAATKVGAG
jgi:myo-inositol 2-dehydrogenase/D-chiro-inositol 1-dehydrogenase